MNDPVANTQLELACRLGLLEDAIEALDDGANIDCNGCSPVFFAIENGDRVLLAALLERGADVVMFEVDESQGEVIDQLLKIKSQAEMADECVADGMVELDAKMIRAFDRMLRNKGIAEPIKKGRLGEYQAFLDGLGSLAAEECQAVVREFLDWLRPEGDADAEESANELLAETENAARLEEWSERYSKATEAELPGELLKDYLKERKKVS